MTIEIKVSKKEFEKLKNANQLDRLMVSCEENKECYTFYDLFRQRENGQIKKR